MTQATAQSTADKTAKLAAEMRPIWVENYKRTRARVLEDDFVCNRCMDTYRDEVNCEFSPKCFLSTDIQIREQDLVALDEDEQNEWWMLNDPVAWARVEIDWEPRWYQIEPMRCTARKKLFRFGRQTGKTEILAVLALYHICTKPDFRVVIVAPYQDQVDLVMARIRKFIQRSAQLSGPEFKVRDKMNPHEIEFYHPEGNSSVLGMTAGVRTGQKGDKFRGQTPSLLIIDEMDMLSDETMESIIASLSGKGHISQMINSSTPTGRHGLYWKFATKKSMGFKEYHFTARVNPNWNADLELFYREAYSENGYTHEIDAGWGEMEVGLFQHKYIDASLREYSIKGAVPRRGELYSIGVDWNRRGIGVHIIITGYDIPNQKFRVAYKEIIDAGEFTQHKAIRRIVALNDVWKPEFVYVDEGEGDTQCEALKIEGMRNPDSGLYHKLKAINFGSKVEVREPMTKAFVKKHVKPFMVNLCVRRVESLACEFPKSEDTSSGLVGQMRDYSIVRWGRDSQPIYTDDSEHTLIAWMLSVYAIIMELSDIAKVKASSRIAFTGPLGEGNAELITRSREKEREVRERRKRLAPVPRTLSPGTTKTPSRVSRGWQVATESGGRDFRNRLSQRTWNRSGHAGRAVWDRKKGHRSLDDFEHD